MIRIEPQGGGVGMIDPHKSPQTIGEDVFSYILIIMNCYLKKEGSHSFTSKKLRDLSIRLLLEYETSRQVIKTRTFIEKTRIFLCALKAVTLAINQTNRFKGYTPRVLKIYNKEPSSIGSYNLDDPQFFTCLGRKTITRYAISTIMEARRSLTKRRELTHNPLVERNITLVLAPLAGFGDILFIYKECLALKAGGFKVSVTIFPCRARNSLEVKEQLINMVGMKDVEIDTHEDVEKRAHKPDCILIGPTVPPYKRIIDLFPNLSGVPFEVIYEYGGNGIGENEQNPFLSFLPRRTGEGKFIFNKNIVDPFENIPIKAGIGVGELGIFTEKGLVKGLSQAEKADKLTLLQTKYCEKMSLILGDSSGEDYLKSTNLFFGYAHRKSSMKRFISSVALSEQLSENTNNIDILLPWRLTAKDSSEYNQKCKYKKSELKDAGIGRVEIITSEGVHHNKVSEDGQGKVLRIINIFPVTNPLMRDLLTVSESLVLITGDQSWNEAMLLVDKMILYEKMAWKVDLYDSMLVKSIPYPLVNNLMNAWDVKDSSPKDVARAIYELRRDSLLHEDTAGSQLEEFHRSIIKKEHSLEKNLIQEALRLSALGKIPEFKMENDQMERKIKDIFMIPLFLETFSKLLLYLIKAPLSEFTLEHRATIHFFIVKFKEIEKSIPSEEVVELMSDAIHMILSIKPHKTIDPNQQVVIIESLLNLPELLFPIIEMKLKELERLT